MRYFFHLFILAIFSLTAAGLAQSFEGIIVQKTTSTESGLGGQMQGMQQMLKNLPPEQRKAAEEAMRGMQGEMVQGETTEDVETMYLKNGKMRIEQKEDGEPVVMIMDFKSHTVYTIYPNRKAYMAINLDEMAEKAKQAQEMMKDMDMSQEQNESAGELKKTGKKKNINGFMCEQYIEKNGNKTSEYWITKEISLKEIFGDYVKSLSSLDFMDPGEDKSMESLFAINGFPILSIDRDEYGTQMEEVLKIEKKKLDSKLFSVPAGYKKVTMQDMMRGNW